MIMIMTLIIIIATVIFGEISRSSRIAARSAAVSPLGCEDPFSSVLLFFSRELWLGIV
jgi:hypothetical protein